MTPDTLAAIVARPTDELERLATAATPGPWHDRLNHKPYRIVVFGGRKAYEAGLTTSDIEAADARFIAAVSPDVVLTLLADRRALLSILRETRLALAEARVVLGGYRVDGRAWVELVADTYPPIDDLLARLAALDTEVPA